MGFDIIKYQHSSKPWTLYATCSQFSASTILLSFCAGSNQHFNSCISI